MENKHYEIILALLAEKVKEQETELGYLRFQKDYLERRLDEIEKGKEIEKGVKQDGKADTE